MVKGYCLKDKKHVEIDDPKYDFNKRGSPVVHGKCPVCKGKVYKTISVDDLPAGMRARAAEEREKAKSRRKSSKKGGKPRARKSASSRKSRRTRSKSRKSKKSRGKK